MQGGVNSEHVKHTHPKHFGGKSVGAYKKSCAQPVCKMNQMIRFNWCVGGSRPILLGINIVEFERSNQYQRVT